MGKLTELLANPQLQSAWAATPAAAEYALLPAGDYECEITAGIFKEVGAKKTPCYQLEFTVRSGPSLRRKLWYPVWITESAMPAAKRDLAKIGVNNLADLQKPLPPGTIVQARVVIENGDDGTSRNKVSSFKFLRREELEPNPFPPQPPSGLCPAVPHS